MHANAIQVVPGDAMVFRVTMKNRTVAHAFYLKIIRFYEIHNSLIILIFQIYDSGYSATNMYTKYFGFIEKPFTLTPNPRFIFLSKNHKEAFAHLLYGINNHYGFIELIGEVGTGKTTVLRTLLNQLSEESYRTALIVNPCLTGVELLRSICHEFGLNSDSGYVNDLLVEINRFLLQETVEGRTVVLVIDESQNLQPEVLEQIRLISNLETENDKLIQIVLAGQPELSTLLERPELRQLNQRIAVRYRLKPMNMTETNAYIRHRMQVAGETGGVSFTPFAYRLIYLYSGGGPRMINILCDRSLLIGYGDERRRITGAIVARAIRELYNVHRGKRLSLAFTSLLVLFVILVAMFLLLNGWLPGIQNFDNIRLPRSSVATVITSVRTPKSIKTAEPEPSTAEVKPTDQRFLELQHEILSIEQNKAQMLAFNAIAELWDAPPINIFNGRLTAPDMFSRFAAKRNLRVTAFKGTLDEVIRFDIPFLVLTRVIGDQDAYPIAVTSVTGDSLSIAPSLFARNTLSRNDLDLISTGTYYLVWQNFGQIPVDLKPGDKRYEISALQHLLKRAGRYNGEIDGDYSAATEKGVIDFQRFAGIPQNETVGELTLAALVKYSANKKAPSISAIGNQK